MSSTYTPQGELTLARVLSLQLGIKIERRAAADTPSFEVHRLSWQEQEKTVYLYAYVAPKGSGIIDAFKRWGINDVDGMIEAIAIRTGILLPEEP